MTDEIPQHEITRLIHAASAPDHAAANQLLTLIYDQLRKIAQQRMNEERREHTLQATALVHEAYMKLVGVPGLNWANRAHFYDAAARAMRQILIDHARRRIADKRGGAAQRVPLTDLTAAFDVDSDQIFAFDAALLRLEGEDAEAATVVRLRFFAGLSIDEVARTLGVSPRKVDLVWARARAWLFRVVQAQR
ncbi:MAG: sigma-70 family RNA polymerase sigma factor [Phycisphaerales bacterium]|nr:sigma-70 family RNA polymerase sigma factor [Phycisphaerales bacterium]